MFDDNVDNSLKKFNFQKTNKQTNKNTIGTPNILKGLYLLLN